MVRAFCWPHAYTFNEQSKMATALTPQTNITSEKIAWLMRTWDSLQKIKLIKNLLKHFFSIFYFIKSETSDSFGNHFDGHFAYLNTLDFYQNNQHRLQFSKEKTEQNKNMIYIYIYLFIYVHTSQTTPNAGFKGSGEGHTCTYISIYIEW